MSFSVRILLSLAALAALSGEAFSQSENLRVGFLTVRTGPLAAGGRQMEEGINLLLKERNYAFAGRKVDIIFADTAGQPALAKTKTQELVEREKVHVISRRSPSTATCWSRKRRSSRPLRPRRWTSRSRRKAIT